MRHINSEKNNYNPDRRILFIVAAFIASATVLTYIPALNLGFVNLDDPDYVYNNPRIQAINIDFIKWIFSTEANPTWHPLTLFSLALDYDLWGLDPSGYHLTNVILHGINTVLVFMLAIRLISSKGERVEFPVAASIAALLFGLHPLHVESVAWISERKDVLCALFFLASLLAYLKYGGRNYGYYSASLLLFVLALMSKPMAVSLPLILLIIDFYPLDRFSREKTVALFIEKMPFLALSLSASLLTIWGHHSADLIVSMERYPLWERILVAAHSYIFYLFKMLIPFNLVPFYPYPSHAEIVSPTYIAFPLLFLIFTVSAILLIRRYKAVSLLWFYYMVVLIPVAGIIKVADFAAADRYTYLPSIAPFLLAGLGIERLASRKHFQNGIAAVATLLFCMLVYFTNCQIEIWKDSTTLWSREIEAFPLPLAYYNRGISHNESGEYPKAISDLSMAIDRFPGYADARLNRGRAYEELGEHYKAIRDFDAALLSFDPIDPKANLKRGDAYQYRGNSYYNLGDYRQAVADYNVAIRLNPQDPDAYNRRGQAYSSLGDHRQAIADFMRTIELEPRHAVAYYNLGRVFGSTGSSELKTAYFKKAAALGLKQAQGVY